MRLLWQIEDSDIRNFKSFYETQSRKSFVQNRIKRNVKKELPPFSKDIFWEAMISCLITTRQRSGPNSMVTKFISTEPFPLSFSQCKSSNNVQNTVERIITSFGGLRRANTIGKEVAFNFQWLENGGWEIVCDMVDNINKNETIETERRSATIIIDKLKGFGPKQSRNLLQSLGLTKYEIPIDSRITKWLNDFGFPLKLSASALSDINYYNFISDGFQKLCEACEIYPCAMDAAIFSSFDDDWPKEKLIW